MELDLSQFLDTFLQESAEHLVNIEQGLLQLKSAPHDTETLNNIFRAAHSIKGGAGIFGMSKAVHFTHSLETLLDQMRGGEISVTAELIDLLLRANDVLKPLLTSAAAEFPPSAEEVRIALEAAGNQAGVPPLSPSNAASCPADLSSGREQEFLVIFRPAPGLMHTGCNPLLLLRNLGLLGTVLATELDSTALPDLAGLNPATSYLGWVITLRTTASESEVREVFEFVEDQSEIDIVLTSGTPSLTPAPANTPREPSGPEIPAAPQKVPPAREVPSIRVATDKIDKVIDLVGEMVIAQAMTARLVQNFTTDALEPLQECVASLDRCIRELHERAMSVRMLPIGSLFGRFQRLVHDLAQQTGKCIRLVTAGEETEIDRGVLELLGDPLTHLIRNSVDHGIESVNDRLLAGKPAEGTIFLRASHVAGNILIEVEDDGAGLDLDRIREKAIAKGLLAGESQLSDQELRLLIFEPGFSTRDEVSDLSGRGVGMDVVKQNVHSLNGSITIASEAGVGTGIHVLLPLTMAILDCLIIRVGSQQFVLPMSSILESICLTDEQIVRVAGSGEVAVVRDQALPLMRLRELFKIESDRPGDEERNLVIVVERDSRKAAFLVDELLGQQRVVVKALERHFRRIEGALGATILGDGKAALILDVAALIESGSKADGLDRPDRARRRMRLVA